MIEFLVVVDNRKSALGIAARNRFKSSNSKVVYASDFKTPNGLLTELVSYKSRTVLFTWRQAFFDLSVTVCRKKLGKFRENLPIGILIPDHLGDCKNFKEIDDAVIHLADFYLVTSDTLLNTYALKNPSFPPVGVLHDIPNADLIRAVRSFSQNTIPKKAIWVGNSDWGRRQGFVDHKGLRKVILPLQGICKSHDGCFEIEIIDTKDNYLQQDDLFMKMAESKFILQSSNAEGTGLSMLEGMGLGCIPITTDVGVVPEILYGSFYENIIKRSPEAFHDALHKLDAESLLTSMDAIDRFEKHVEKSFSEEITPTFGGKDCKVIIISRFRKSIIRASWYYRYKKYGN